MLGEPPFPAGVPGTKLSPGAKSSRRVAGAALNVTDRLSCV
jgi:hypothetical protein